MIVDKTESVPAQVFDNTGDAISVAPNVMQIALQIRSARTSPDAPLDVLLLPVTAGHSISGLAEELGSAFRKLGDGPVMVAGFGASREPSPPILARSAHSFLSATDRLPEPQPVGNALDGPVGPKGIATAQVSDVSPADLPLTERIALFLNQAKRSFRTVVVQGEVPAEGVESMIAASACASTVLVVASGITTRTELREIRAVLDRCGARVQGFIYDSAPAVADKRRPSA